MLRNLESIVKIVFLIVSIILAIFIVDKYTDVQVSEWIDKSFNSEPRINGE